MKRILPLAFAFGLLVSGCAYNRYNADFFAQCRANVPEVRAYARSHLLDLSDADKRIINITQPKLAQANWVTVDFTWPHICRVNTGAPPKCQPFTTTDLRRINGGGKGAPAEPSPLTVARIKSLGIPCGTYAPARVITDNFGGSYTDITPPVFTLCLETNGTYVAESSFPKQDLHDNPVSMSRNFEQSGWYWRAPDRPVGVGIQGVRNIQHGRWHWSPISREFILDPGNFTFYIHRLPVDPNNPNHLLWGKPDPVGGQSYLERIDDQSPATK